MLMTPSLLNSLKEVQYRNILPRPNLNTIDLGVRCKKRRLEDYDYEVMIVR